MKLTFLFKCSFKGAKLVCFMDLDIPGECPFPFLTLALVLNMRRRLRLARLRRAAVAPHLLAAPPSAAIRGAHAPHSGSFVLPRLSGGLAAVSHAYKPSTGAASSAFAPQALKQRYIYFTWHMPSPHAEINISCILLGLFYGVAHCAVPFLLFRPPLSRLRSVPPSSFAAPRAALSSGLALTASPTTTPL